MARVELIDADQAPVSAKPLYEGGDPGPLVAAWAQVPEMLDVTLPFISMILNPSSIGVRHKEFGILRTSAVLQCRYCINSHTEVALDVGLEPDEVAALRGERDLATVFDDPAELALLAWIDAVALGPGPVPDDLATAMSEHFTDAEIVELTMLVGATLLLNRFATSLQLPTTDEALARLADAGFESPPADGPKGDPV